MLADESAGTPQAVRDMIGQVAPAALARAREEAADIQKLIDQQASAKGTASFRLEPVSVAVTCVEVAENATVPTPVGALGSLPRHPPFTAPGGLYPAASAAGCCPSAPRRRRGVRRR